MDLSDTGRARRVETRLGLARLHGNALRTGTERCAYCVAVLRLSVHSGSGGSRNSAKRIVGQRAAQDTTVYHLASLTKPFASTVLLQLMEEGKVSLDDPVSIQGRARHLALRTVDGELVAHHQGAGPGTHFRRAGQHR